MLKEPGSSIKEKENRTGGQFLSSVEGVGENGRKERGGPRPSMKKNRNIPLEGIPVRVHVIVGGGT